MLGIALLAISLVVLAAVGLFADADVTVPDGEQGNRFTVVGVVLDCDGSPHVGSVYVTATQEGLDSSREALLGPGGALSVDLTIPGLNLRSTVGVVIWTRPAAAALSLKRSVFIDQLDGGAAFQRGRVARVGSQLVLDIGTAQESLPPSIGRVSLPSPPASPARLTFEAASWGEDPFVSHLSSSDLLALVPPIINCYSWTSIGKIRLCIDSPDYGRLAKVDLMRNQVVTIHNCGAGKIHGSVSSALFPTARFALARPAADPSPSAPDPLRSSLVQSPDFGAYPTGVIESGSFEIYGVDPGDYRVELWSDEVPSALLSISHAIVVNESSTPAAF